MLFKQKSESIYIDTRDTEYAKRGERKEKTH